MYAPCITKHRRKESSINIVQDDPWGWHHIGFHRAVLRVEVDQGQRADKRNQSQEDEPCPLAGILQTAYRNGQKYFVGEIQNEGTKNSRVLLSGFPTAGLGYYCLFFVFHSGLCSGEACDGHTEGRAAHIVETYAVAELH